MNENESEPAVATTFVATAETYRLDGLHQDALVTLLKGLSENPSHDQARLLLARVFFELECIPFALNELRQLCQRYPNNVSLAKLYSSLGGEEIKATSSGAGSVLAESEIDFDAIEELERDS